MSWKLTILSYIILLLLDSPFDIYINISNKTKQINKYTSSSMYNINNSRYTCILNDEVLITKVYIYNADVGI